jgi:hypothetical protein
LDLLSQDIGDLLRTVFGGGDFLHLTAIASRELNELTNLCPNFSHHFRCAT